jgi:Nuclease-related domain
MKSYIDHQKVSRRAMLANVASVGGLIVLLGSVALPLIRPAFTAYSTIVMLAGLAIAMLGIYYANRWVKKPRPEQRLDEALKGLSDSHCLFHYPSLPCDHLLLSPTGVVVLETVNLEGLFSYKDGKWRENMTMSRAVRYIVEEHLGNPIKSALATENYIKKTLSRQVEGGEAIPVRSVVVFVHPHVELHVENPEIPVLKLDKLRKHLSPKASKDKKLPEEVYSATLQFFESA